MNNLRRRMLFIKDKKVITLFITLVNINCLAYYVFSKTLFNSVATSNKQFIASAILAIFDLLLCGGFIQLYVIGNTYKNEGALEETSSALKTAQSLIELYRGNIISSRIYSFDYVTQIEREAVKGDEIWCISGDIEEDSQNKDLGSIINNNLENGVIYKYFITHEGESISSKASWGEKKLREENQSYKKRLIFVEVSEELVAPDIDIIIYKANQIKERVGFVCVEIGDDQETYVYQQIDYVTLQGICDRLKKYGANKKQIDFSKLYSIFIKFAHYFVEHLFVIYFIASAGGLALLSFTKIVSLTSAVLFLLPAVLELLITIALIMGIANAFSTYKEMINLVSQNESILANVINNQEVKLVADALEEKTLDELMYHKGLGRTDRIVQIDSNCSAIWILSDLSHDIANQDFFDWLIEELNSYSNVKCHILHTTGAAALGRTQKLNLLKERYSNRIVLYPISDISTHYIWSETYGIILMENINKQHDVYISLGDSNDAFYKKVITTEEEASTLLGRLKNIAGLKP